MAKIIEILEHAGNCSPKLAGAARIAMVAFSIVGPFVGAGLIWTGSRLVDKIDWAVTTIFELRQELKGITVDLQAKAKELDANTATNVRQAERIEDHERRIYRLEGTTR